MRTLVAVLTALIVLAPASAEAAKKKPKPTATAAWAKKHKLKGNWKAKDTDRDGIKNLAEYKLHTNPRKADTDRDGLKDGDEIKSANDPLDRDTDGDGIKDGAEHAGVVTAFDGETIVIRQFNGPVLTAALDCGELASTSSVPADEGPWEEEDADDGYDEPAEGEDPELDLADDCFDVAVGDVLNQAEVEDYDGELLLVDLEVA